MIVECPRTIMNSHARGQTVKNIIDNHEDFEQVQTEVYSIMNFWFKVNDS